MAGLERRLELIEAERKMGEAARSRGALRHLSDEDLDALEDALLAGARARGEQPPPNGLLSKMKRWEAETIEQQRINAKKGAS